MGHVIPVKPHLTEEEINHHVKKVSGFWLIRRWMVIRHALVDPAPVEDIALRLGLSVFTVRDLIQSYNRQGPRALETPGKGQRQRAYLAWDKEQSFLAPFIEQSRAGQTVTAREIKEALEEYLGHPVSKSMVFRMLNRHQWHKIVLRPQN
jgi:transposase